MFAGDPILALVSLIGIVLFMGGTIGWFTGEIMRRILPKSKQKVFLDVVLGSIGFLSGVLLSSKYADISIRKEWYNGKLVYQETTGFEEVLIMVVIPSIGAVVVYYCLEAVRRIRYRNT